MSKAVKIGAVILIAVVLAGGLWGSCAAYKSTEREVTATVEGKERVCSFDSDNRQTCEYLVFTTEGTFSLTDSLLYGRFRSSDVYGRLREDRTYTFRVVGFRLPLASEYPNIISDPKEVQR